MTRYLSRRPQIRRLDRCRYTVDGREVDFGPAVGSAAGEQLYPIS